MGKQLSILSHLKLLAQKCVTKNAELAQATTEAVTALADALDLTTKELSDEELLQMLVDTGIVSPVGASTGTMYTAAGGGIYLY